jgi:type IX secretion system PorP/SprF family membrane protein
MKKQFVILIFFILIIYLCLAQDIHFSQFDNSPLMINPALTGEYSGKGRFMLNYRNQWRSITKNSYRTFAFSSDRSFSKDKFAAGILVFKDVAGDADMSISQINLTAASKIQINKTDFFKLGLQATWSQRHIDINSLTWNSQYDGNMINPNLYSGEPYYQESYGYIDFTTGILWTHMIENKQKLKVGISAFHVNRPQSNFLSENNTLNIRWCLHADVSFKLSSDNLTLSPSMLIMQQGRSNEVNIGAIMKYNVGNNSRYTGLLKSSSIFLGAYYRHNDAIIIYTGLDYKNQFDFCFSYDINVSGLVVASNARGGAEVSLNFIIPDKPFVKLK